MTDTSAREVAKAVVRRNTEEVQGGGDFDLFETLRRRFHRPYALAGPNPKALQAIGIDVITFFK